MKMVRVGDKMVPEFAADGKGSNDLKKAMYGAMMKRAKYGTEIGKKYMMSGGEVMRYAENGTEVNGGDPKKKGSPYETSQQTVSASYRSNEGMQQARTPGKIDAYNFSLPPSGRLEDMDEDMKRTLVESEFGQQYLSGEGSLDQQYNQYATAVVGFMKRNPQQALKAINQMIESGNENFQGLADLSDEEKIERATRYMTDKKVGDFHGALKFGEALVPTARFYDPNDAVSGAGFRGGRLPRVLAGVRNRTVKPGDISMLAEAAAEQGVDLSVDNEKSRMFVEAFMDERGSQQRGPVYDEEGNFADSGTFEGADNQYFINQAKGSAAARMRSASEMADERRRLAMERINEQKSNMSLGGMIYQRRGDKGLEVKGDKQPVSEEKKGLFNKTVRFGKDNENYVKTRTALGRFFAKNDIKASF